MADQTDNLSLPYIMPSQAQKHVTHNEAIRMLDALLHIELLSFQENVPPQEPMAGDRHIVGENPEGDWEGYEGMLAAWQDGAWAFHEPKAGWIVHDQSQNSLKVFDGQEWSEITSSGASELDLNTLGVNATADENNRLAVGSNSSLFTHEGTDHRLTINKATQQDTASVVFQDNWSGRAEFGLTGDDDWHVKVSSDGNGWKEALIADQDTGAVQFPSGIIHSASGQRPQSFIGIPRTSGSMFRIDSLHAQNPRTAIISAIDGDVITLTTNDAELFFSHYMAGEVLARIWNITQSSDQHSAWVKLGRQIAGVTSPGKVTFNQTRNDQLMVSDAGDIAGWQAGDRIQIGDPHTITPNRCSTFDISPMMQNRFGSVFYQTGIFAKYYISGNTSVLSSLQTVGVGITPNGLGGSFNNGVSNNQGVPGQGLFYIPCSRPSPVSDSYLVSVRENGPSGAIGISLVAILGLLVEM